MKYLLESQNYTYDKSILDLYPKLKEYFCCEIDNSDREKYGVSPKTYIHIQYLPELQRLAEVVDNEITINFWDKIITINDGIQEEHDG